MHRAVALNPKPDNILDHLGVLAAILEIPLIVTEQKTYDLAASLYPQVNTILMDQADITLSFLAENFDILFVSSKLWAIEYYPMFPLFCNKNMRIVYCPHGNSDKGHTVTEELPAAEDISLVYGDHMLDLLKDTGVLKNINQTIATGNYRHSFFRQHQDFYQKWANDAVLSKLDRTKTTIFYAPTWQGTENPSSFYTDCEALIKQITPPFNLLIKLHPYLYERDLIKTTLIVERYKDHPQVLFLEDFPPIYPLMALADAYLGDFSSIGYDFLSFDKPMYFFNPGNSDLHQDRGRFLHRCGMEISTKSKENVFDLIARTLSENQSQFSQIRKEIYQYTFGKEKCPEQLRRDIFSIV